jgi:hypothetical protein
MGPAHQAYRPVPGSPGRGRLGFHIWDVVAPPDLSEERIQREMQRLHR